MLKNRHSSRGFSLVELLIATTLGLFITAGTISVFVTTVKSSSDNLKTTRLNQDLRVVMDIMLRDLRRAAYWGKSGEAIGTGLTNPFTLGNPSNFNSEAANSCLIYSYDADGDGNIDLGSSGSGATAGEDERYGFRLSNGAVQMRQTGAACSAASTANGWQNITDDTAETITSLNFLLDSPAVDLDGNVLTSANIKVRKVTVTLSAQLNSDTSVTRSLSETVRVRNDIYTP